MSIDAAPAHQQLLCAQYGSGPSRAWIDGDYSCCNDNPAAKTSTPIHLVAGNEYFLQCLYEGPANQDKNCSVTWAFTGTESSYSVTNFDTPRSVGLVPWALTNGTVWVTASATNPPAGTMFQLNGQDLVAPSGPNSFQWYSNGVAIPHATGLSYSVAAAEPNNSGTYLLVVNTASPHLSFTSPPVTVAVNLPQANLSSTYALSNSSGTLTIGWGVAGVLQQATSLMPPVNWVDVTNAPSGPNGGTFPIQLTNTWNAMYYRLKQWP